MVVFTPLLLNEKKGKKERRVQLNVPCVLSCDQNWLRLSDFITDFLILF